MKFLVPAAIVLAAVLIAETTFIIYFVEKSPVKPTDNISDVGLTSSIGGSLFTTYLLPFEITSILLLMAIVGAMTLARRIRELPPGAAVVPGAQVVPLHVLDPGARMDEPLAVEAYGTEQVAETLGISDPHDRTKRD